MYYCLMSILFFQVCTNVEWLVILGVRELVCVGGRLGTEEEAISSSDRALSNQLVIPISDDSERLLPAPVSRREDR